eukprot:jgi/Bigna1/135657/aug1.30_g10365
MAELQQDRQSGAPPSSHRQNFHITGGRNCNVIHDIKNLEMKKNILCMCIVGQRGSVYILCVNSGEIVAELRGDSVVRRVASNSRALPEEKVSNNKAFHVNAIAHRKGAIDVLLGCSDGFLRWYRPSVDINSPSSFDYQLVQKKLLHGCEIRCVVKSTVIDDNGQCSFWTAGDDGQIIENGTRKVGVGLLLVPFVDESISKFLDRDKNEVDSRLSDNLHRVEIQDVHHGTDVRCMIGTEKHVWTGGQDGVVTVWDRKSMQKIVEVKAHEKFGVTCMAQANGLVWTGGSHGISIWSAATFDLVDKLSLPKGNVTCIKAYEKGDSSSRGPSVERNSLNNYEQGMNLEVERHKKVPKKKSTLQQEQEQHFALQNLKPRMSLPGEGQPPDTPGKGHEAISQKGEHRNTASISANKVTFAERDTNIADLIVRESASESSQQTHSTATTELIRSFTASNSSSSCRRCRRLARKAASYERKLGRVVMELSETRRERDSNRATAARLADRLDEALKSVAELQREMKYIENNDIVENTLDKLIQRAGERTEEFVSSMGWGAVGFGSSVGGFLIMHAQSHSPILHGVACSAVRGVISNFGTRQNTEGILNVLLQRESALAADGPFIRVCALLGSLGFSHMYMLASAQMKRARKRHYRKLLGDVQNGMLIDRETGEDPNQALVPLLLFTSASWLALGLTLGWWTSEQKKNETSTR